MRDNASAQLRRTSVLLTHANSTGQSFSAPGHGAMQVLLTDEVGKHIEGKLANERIPSTGIAQSFLAGKARRACCNFKGIWLYR